MAVELFRTATEYVWFKTTAHRGSLTSATPCGVYFTDDPSDIPAVDDFTSALLVPPGHEDLGDGKDFWVAALVGPDSDPKIELQPGDYQAFVLIEMGSEKIIRRPGVVTIR